MNLVRDKKTDQLFCSECFSEVKESYEALKGLDEKTWYGIRSSNEHLFSDELNKTKVWDKDENDA
jgi:hypothetical protein